MNCYSGCGRNCDGSLRRTWTPISEVRDARRIWEISQVQTLLGSGEPQYEVFENNLLSQDVAA